MQSCIREQEQRNEVKNTVSLHFFVCYGYDGDVIGNRSNRGTEPFCVVDILQMTALQGGRKSGTVLVLGLLRAHLPDPR